MARAQSFSMTCGGEATTLDDQSYRALVNQDLRCGQTCMSDCISQIREQNERLLGQIHSAREERQKKIQAVIDQSLHEFAYT